MNRGREAPAENVIKRRWSCRMHLAGFILVVGSAPALAQREAPPPGYENSDAYRDGYQRGYDDGYARGYRKALEESRAAAVPAPPPPPQPTGPITSSGAY